MSGENMWPYGTHAVLLMSFISAISAMVTLWVWRRRTTPTATYLTASLSVATLWLLGYAIELTQTEVSGLVFWNKVQYTLVLATMLTWLAFVLRYTDYERWVTWRTFALLAIVPAITVLLAWTNEFHGLLWQDIRPNPAGAVPSTLAVRGPWYWVNVVYSYLLLLGGTFLLVRRFARSPDLFRRQATTLLIAMLAPWIANILHIANMEPVPGLKLTPLAFTVTNLAFAWSLFRYRLLDIVPVARATLIEKMSDAVIVLDAQNRLVDLNPVAQQLLGLASAKPVGQPADQILSSWPELAEHCCAGVTQEVQTEIGHHTGQAPRTFDLRLSPLRDRRGQITGLLIVLRDITERARAAQQREQLIADLNAFAHTVAHDLKTPLTAIIGYNALLEKRFAQAFPAQARDFIGTIGQNGRKMENIINELLLLATVQHMDAVEIKPLDMAAIVAETQTHLSYLIAECQAEIVIPPEWPTALGYTAWVEEVWANYLSNAIKYGGHPPHIELGATVLDENQVRFWVCDNGPGISPEEQARLFTPFTRLDQRPARGHGLGLSIVKRIVDKLGGQVGVQSALGQGSTFSFSLPMAGRSTSLTAGRSTSLTAGRSTSLTAGRSASLTASREKDEERSGK